MYLTSLSAFQIELLRKLYYDSSINAYTRISICKYNICCVLLFVAAWIFYFVQMIVSWLISSIRVSSTMLQSFAFLTFFFGIFQIEDFFCLLLILFFMSSMHVVYFWLSLHIKSVFVWFFYSWIHFIQNTFRLSSLNSISRRLVLSFDDSRQMDVQWQTTRQASHLVNRIYLLLPPPSPFPVHFPSPY